eukprot:CAMPEP_0180622506 /NCGR_PEP_ID=MMETSP1037_2-20121125/35723_1 /TAXON_ID=632150 /ORGANISM="Azadinium spinosum, Strain 3D9" /LENGTH=257 /DNA_ID=CAMNT_0022642763 /DNA_START=58 /DNA_END=831 /DNA_ORIENTATION=+
MSRAAASQAAKADQKAAIAAKNVEKERLAALGMNKTIKQAIGADVLLCTQCGATAMGPGKCECPGGVRRPAADHDSVVELIAAAKARMAITSAENKKASAAVQSGISKQRSKAKEAREADANDLNAEFQGDDVECRQIVEFPVGKLGMDIEKNAISKVAEAPSQALDLGVKVGWVVCQVNGTVVTTNKKAIIKEVTTAMKLGPVKFTFRVPIMDGYHFCTMCDKFKETAEFESSQLEENGPGKQLCSGCEDFADMDF